MTRGGAIVLGVAMILAAATITFASPKSAAPQVDEIDGLQAWFKTDSLHARLQNGDAVSTWPDSSRRGHDLVDDGNGRPAIFEVRQIGDHAVVRVGKDAYSVSKPFELQDHTIFLVYEAARPRLGLFQGEAEEQMSNGVVLRQEGKRDLCQSDNAAAPYTRDVDLEPGFNITALGRESGGLYAFVNGSDQSSGEQLSGALRVGRLFRFRQTRAVIPDALGLRVAEMIFYDRFLTEDERAAVTLYLSEKYAIPLAPEVVLATASPQDVNSSSASTIEWDDPIEVRSPFRHDPANQSTRLYCTRDGTRLSLSVTLALSTSTPGTVVRILVMKNYKEYLTEEASSRDAEAVRLELTVAMNDGDFIEVVTIAEGEAGPVTVEPGKAELRAGVLP